MERLCILYILAMTGAIAVEGLCFYQCPAQVNENYVSLLPVKGITGKASCEHPSVATVEGEVQECYMRSGTFFIQRRNDNEYRCIKQMATDPIKGLVVILYVKPWVCFPNNPDVCDVCAVEVTWTPLVFIAEEVYGTQCYENVTVPPMGCNVPYGCSMKNPYTDILCTGCEPKEDDGLCCAGCHRKRTYY